MQMMMMQSPPPPHPAPSPASAAEYHPKPFPKYREVVAPSSMDSAVESDSTESHPKNPTRRRSKRRRKLIVKVALAEPPPTPQEAEQQQVSSVSDTFSTEDCALSLMMLSRDKWKVKNEDQSVEEEDEMEQEMEEEDDVVFRARSTPRTSSQGKYKCDTCKKVFQSYQALGGHRASHKRVRHQVFEDDDDDVDGGDDSEEEEDGNGNGSGGNVEGYNGNSAVVEHPPPRSFECPFCFKLFDSGQALGGHKKVHYYNNTSYYNNRNNFPAAANSNNNNNNHARASSSSANFGDNLVIDLNFPPAPEEEFEFSTVSD